ncbi:metallophosphoesterase family protein [methanotrophic endosymbiont of Bathymodiolus puteoserpentis (Logatchev)]|uniref:metallophosphoesterase family protein n=1 Tax=methanotrophic endosymbiont of Bathymodiolus puteoserpentis (Logatchev) TaxID=343235 RepID=UPI0013C97622|nr:metallophosphoesterase [methanotrophic endosymbiont of Bathymodiolus puteoserpentis (Logatchev)]SHE23054.1 Diadenosine tetraphosphatase and related serine/threonine protein phosphatases [methanotrophic endosymbiont of Bathymodiolus puteoserpentis (Logatchev)]
MLTTINKNQILFAGDPHGCFNNLVSAVLKYRPAAVVMLGDYNLECSLEQYLQAIIEETKIYWIPGNHDFDSRAEYEYLFHSALSYNNLHLKVMDVGGVRIAGLGGIFAGRIWRPGDFPRWEDKKHWLKSQPSNVKKIPLHIDNAIWHHEFEWMKRNFSLSTGNYLKVVLQYIL